MISIKINSFHFSKDTVRKIFLRSLKDAKLMHSDINKNSVDVWVGVEVRITRMQNEGTAEGDECLSLS